MTPAEHHRAVAADFTRLVDAVTDAEWDGPTPVTEWRVRDIIGHLVEWLPGFLAGGSAVQLAHIEACTPDPAAAWSARRDAVQALLDDDDQSAQPLHNPHIGETTVGDAIDRFYTSDVFMHSWDLARATGQPDPLDHDVCAEMLAGMEPLDGLLRASGQFGPRFEAPPDATASDRLMAFLGRDPAWKPPAPHHSGRDLV